MINSLYQCCVYFYCTQTKYSQTHSMFNLLLLYVLLTRDFPVWRPGSSVVNSLTLFTVLLQVPADWSRRGRSLHLAPVSSCWCLSACRTNTGLFNTTFPVSSYYVNGRDASVEDFLDPGVLDTLTAKTSEVLQVKTCSRHTSGSYGSSSVVESIRVFPPCPGSKPGFSREEGLAWRDKFRLWRRSQRTVGHLRRRIHVSLRLRCSSHRVSLELKRSFVLNEKMRCLKDFYYFLTNRLLMSKNLSSS